MNYIHMHTFMRPHLLEENQRALEREHELQRRLREARAARPSRVAALMERLRHALRPEPCPRPLEGC